MARSAKSPAVSTASDLPAEISAWLSDPGFTPGAKHLAKLFAALAGAEREDARKLERVLGARAKPLAASRSDVWLRQTLANARACMRCSDAWRTARPEPNFRAHCWQGWK